MNPIPMWIYAAVIAVALAFGGVQTVRIAGLKTDAAMQAKKYSDDTAKLETQRADAERDGREKERKLSEDAATFAKGKQDEINAINDRLTTALVSLRNRPERPAAVASGSNTPAIACKGATGAGLFRPDAEFLIREAARADKLRAGLAQCYQQYDAAKITLEQQ